MAALEEIKKQYVASVEDLKVFQRSFALSLAVHRATLEFPKEERYALASQMQRASKAICGNLGEGYAKQSFSVPEFQRFLGMAIGSAGEMRVWVKYAHALNYINERTAAEWSEEYLIIERMLGKLRANAGGI